MLPVIKTSHPSRVRGLKCTDLDSVFIHPPSHPSRVRGLKYAPEDFCFKFFGVAPLAGAWIEMPSYRASVKAISSHPSRVRGLKFAALFSIANPFVVAPLAGAWIEIRVVVEAKVIEDVAPLAGAWIEIFVASAIMAGALVAPLAGAWIEIGGDLRHYGGGGGRTPRGCVD